MNQRQNRRPKSRPAPASSPPVPPAPGLAPADFLPPRLQGLLLVLFIFLAYLPAFHAGFIWDDDRYVTDNPLLSAPDGWRRIWFSFDSPSQYFPLTYSVFRLQYDLWGLVPAPYHAVNLLVHAANVLLLWQLLRRMAIPAAWLAAAIFALHPVQVESVAWISELKNLLSLFFILLALLAWLEFIKKERAADWRWYGLALGAQALALTAKSSACTLPAALLLLLWLRHQPIRWPRLAQMLPFLALGAVSGLLAMWWERFHQGTEGQGFALTFPERLLVASHAIWFYLGKLVWPAQLLFSYPRWTLNPADPLAYGWLAATLAVVVIILLGRRRVGRGPEAALTFYVLTLSPLLGFIMLFTFLYSFVADHYQYVACIGPIALAAAGIVRAGDRFARTVPYLKQAVCALLLLVLGLLTWRQCGIYSNSETLWRATLQGNPGSWMARVNLGEYLASQGRLEEAVSLWQQALKLNPADAPALYDLGVAASQIGHLSEAVEDYRRALEIEPGFTKAANRLAWLLAASPEPAIQNAPEAVRWAERANQLSQNSDATVLATLAAAYAAAGRFPEAVAAAQRSLQLAPAQTDDAFMASLREQLKSYQAGVPYRDAALH